MSAPLRALLEFDLLRLREFARRLKGDAWSAAVTLLVAGGAVAALLLGLERLGRERLADHPGLAAVAGAALGAFVVLGQRQAAGRMADGPFAAALAPRSVRTAWSALRVAAVALLPAAALAIGALRGGGERAAGAVLAGLALAAAVAIAVPAPRLILGRADAPTRAARATKRAVSPLHTTLSARVAGGLPRWVLLPAACAALAALARLAQANGNPSAAHALLFAGTWACGAMVAPASDLFAFLARTPKPLARLLVGFALTPALAGLVAGALAAAVVPGAGAAEASAVGLGALACGLALAVQHLNQLAYGPVIGPARLSIYAGLAAIGALALGPFVSPFVVGGLVLLARTAARRRWSAA